MSDLTVAAELVLGVAGLEAQRSRAAAIAPDHLLVALFSLEKLLEPSTGLTLERQAAIRPEHDALDRILHSMELDAASIRREIRTHIPEGPRTGTAAPPRDPACRAIFERAAILVRAHGNTECGVLHLLAAALATPTEALQAAIPQRTAGYPLFERLRAWVHAAIAPAASRAQNDRTRPTPGPDPIPPFPHGPMAPTSISPFPHGPMAPTSISPTPMMAPPGPPEREPDRRDPPAPGVGVPPDPPPGPSPGPAVPAVLLRYGRDLTAEAEAGTLGPVIGRQAEMLQVVRVLHRRTKNSPVLIGEAGVGKTAVVEGLACRIAEGAVLPGRRIVALDLARVLAGTSYRGQFEERLEEILAALREHPNVILFLDELHTIVGAGDADGRLDAANVLKPALARGEIACIGATTLDEYRQHVERDAALERRFQPVLVSEPSLDETRAMLAGLQHDLERHHAVSIDADAIEAAVALTVRYVTTRRLPDKAVDALDEACARASVPTLTPLTGDEQRRAAGAGGTGGTTSARGAVGSDGPGDPAGLESPAPAVTRQTVAEVVSAWTGIPLGRIGQGEADRLADLESRLAARVVGQPQAISQVAQRVRMARAGLTAPDRPAGVLLFVGPSGVGKTELAYALAEVMADVPGDGRTGPGGSSSPIRLDMSEYGERHHAARLIGAPPGYAGHGDDGQLTGPLRRNPYAVVLLDEVEKAHPEVFDLFLQLFDAGRLTDGRGRLVDGRQAIFVLTSNLGASGDSRPALGFGQPSGSVSGRPEGAAPAGRAAADRAVLLAELRGFFRPELLNRIDEIVRFAPLDEAALAEVARRRVGALGERLLEQHQIDLTATDAALLLVARLARSGTGAAREVHRVIARAVEEPLSRDLLAGRLTPGAQVLVDAQAGALQLLYRPSAM